MAAQNRFFQGGWHQVNRKGKHSFSSNKWDIMKNASEGSIGEVTSFFITDFDHKWRARDLFFEFKDLGVVDEIVIPPKRDWRGEKYGFVRFVNVVNIRVLETKLNNLWLEGRKLNANVSKFKRKEWPGKAITYHPFTRGSKDGANGVVNKGDQRRSQATGGEQNIEYKVKFNSYADTLKNNFPTIAKQGGASKSESIHKAPEEVSYKETINKSFFFRPNEEEKDRYRKAWVGVAKYPGMAFGVSDSLLVEGFFSVAATPLGPNLYLLEEDKEGDLATFLSKDEEWKERWFKEVLNAEVRRWQPTDVECYRSVWVSIYGIPCFVRNRRFCESLLSDIGVVAKGDCMEGKQIRLDVTSLLIFTNLLDTINRKVAVSIEGVWYDILVKEDVTVKVGDKEESWAGSEFSLEEAITDGKEKGVFYHENKDGSPNGPTVIGPKVNSLVDPVNAKDNSAVKPLWTVDNYVSPHGDFFNSKLDEKGVGPRQETKENIKVVKEGAMHADIGDRVENKPLSFDEQCKKLKNSKKVRKQLREIFDLGERVDNFVYPADLVFLMNSGNESRNLHGGCSAGRSISIDSLTNSDVMNCIARVIKRTLGNNSEGLWKSMNNLGITNSSVCFERCQRGGGSQGDG
ncbi:uncharacterized protein LOC131598405 [Vicia villosa]|uniref:uncharacterized protein LOC131598405 n=1 Tax=Vicia villosa TaxID=3911 RepID=UPI00273BB866|nr:uncharacterized protein LOC131598405 [Vicia villosa]